MILQAQAEQDMDPLFANDDEWLASVCRLCQRQLKARTHCAAQGSSSCCYCYVARMLPLSWLGNEQTRY